ncbi:hypothetical protein DFH08DRAFT_823418 [Mycena albidolilacea]|uniref:Uncharacterized protein n=1 Tax=Mycena albidolilacea TaxID=1033008 RepID=A0AAD6Z6W0_9AGAR|nr:hypothetical protein DFH08DRAFT_823418 [Mycena albidolilacea]
MPKFRNNGNISFFIYVWILCWPWVDRPPKQLRCKHWIRGSAEFKQKPLESRSDSVVLKQTIPMGLKGPLKLLKSVGISAVMKSPWSQYREHSISRINKRESSVALGDLAGVMDARTIHLSLRLEFTPLDWHLLRRHSSSNSWPLGVNHRVSGNGQTMIHLGWTWKGVLAHGGEMIILMEWKLKLGKGPKNLLLPGCIENLTWGLRDVSSQPGYSRPTQLKDVSATDLVRRSGSTASHLGGTHHGRDRPRTPHTPQGAQGDAPARSCAPGDSSRSPPPTRPGSASAPTSRRGWRRSAPRRAGLAPRSMGGSQVVGEWERGAVFACGSGVGWGREEGNWVRVRYGIYSGAVRGSRTLEFTLGGWLHRQGRMRGPGRPRMSTARWAQRAVRQEEQIM